MNEDTKTEPEGFCPTNKPTEIVACQTPNPPSNSAASSNDNIAETPAALKKSKRRILQVDFPDKPHKNYHQTPATIENVRHMLDQNGIEVRYNVIKKKHEIRVPKDCGTPDNRDATAISKILSLASLNGIATGLVQNYVEAIGDMNPYNPVEDWISSRPWDGRDRLPELAATITLRKGHSAKLAATMLKKWLLSAVAAVQLSSCFRSRGVLVLQGPQGIGKTSWCLRLASDPHIRETCFKVDHHLDSQNKDSILGAITHWIVELGELDSSFKKDVARLKGFLTSTHDKVRRPYGRTESEYPRRTVFLATVNEHNYLVDTTGNSRWWTIPCEKLDFKHDIDMQQVFAQLAVELAAGEEWWLTPAEEAELEALNAMHQSASVIAELISDHFDMTLVGNTDLPAKTPSEVLRALGFDNPTNAQAKECGAILRQLLGDPKRIRGADKWRIPGSFSEHSGQMIALDVDGPPKAEPSWLRANRTEPAPL